MSSFFVLSGTRNYGMYLDPRSIGFVICTVNISESSDYAAISD